MTDIRSLLTKAAQEIRLSKETGIEQAWRDRIAFRMERAALSPEHDLERQVSAITRSLVYSGPMDEASCPSFWQTVGYFQRIRKHAL